MDILEIKTSKNGLIWPTGYWKTLIDSIFRNGSRNNPLCTYCDFKKYLEGKVIVSSSRYFFPLTKTFSSNDDSILKAISVEKVKPGLEKVQLKQEHHIVPNFDSNIEFEYFGTIGNKTYESQSKRNRENLSNKFKNNFESKMDSSCLKLGFQLNDNQIGSNRRNRDLDNLVDALIPEFNKYFRHINKLLLYKIEQSESTVERLHFSLIQNI